MVVATTGMLVARLDGRWRGWGWDEVLRGGWREEDSVLFWEASGESLECVLDSPGELLSIFRERVLASTVMTINHDLPHGAVQIIARRNLLEENVIIGHLVPAGTGSSIFRPIATSGEKCEKKDEAQSILPEPEGETLPPDPEDAILEASAEAAAVESTGAGETEEA